MSADGNLAASFQAMVHRPFRPHTGGSIHMMQRFQQRVDTRIVAATFDADGALPDGRQAVLGLNRGADAFPEAETNQAGRCQDNRIVVTGIQLAQARVDIAAERFDFQVRTAIAQLALSPQA